MTNESRNGNGRSAEKHENSLALQDVLVLQDILRQLEQGIADYNAALGEVRAHQDQIAKERALLGALRARLVGMHDQGRAWGNIVWHMGWRNGVTREARERVERQIRAYESLLDELIWQLLDFRASPKGDSHEGS